jgi:hypothetical protein
LIREQEEAYFEANPEKWEAEKFPIGERRVLYCIGCFQYCSVVA